MTSRKYRIAVCGGTFDLFHIGHENFLHSVFKNSEKVTIGLASDEFSSKKNIYESYEVRKKSLLDFLQKNKYSGEIVKIDDLYGPTISSGNEFDVIFVTSDSMNGAIEINRKRKALKLNELAVEKIEIEKADDGKNISSNRIKMGEIDRSGNLYIDKEFLKYNYALPSYLRKKLSEPFGEIIKDFDKYLDNSGLDSKKIITVGDVVSSKVFSKGISPKAAIVDLVVNREKKFSDVFQLGFKNAELFKAKNPAGSVTSELIKAVKKAFEKENAVVQVLGEEDLAVIPVVLVSPLGYEIYYGQPKEGVVKIVVTEKIKNEIKSLISKFERKVL